MRLLLECGTFIHIEPHIKTFLFSFCTLVKISSTQNCNSALKKTPVIKIVIHTNIMFSHDQVL